MCTREQRTLWLVFAGQMDQIQSAYKILERQQFIVASREDFQQPAQTRRLIRVLPVRTCHMLHFHTPWSKYARLSNYEKPQNDSCFQPCRSQGEWNHARQDFLQFSRIHLLQTRRLMTAQRLVSNQAKIHPYECNIDQSLRYKAYTVTEDFDWCKRFILSYSATHHSMATGGLARISSANRKESREFHAYFSHFVQDTPPSSHWNSS